MTGLTGGCVALSAAAFVVAGGAGASTVSRSFGPGLRFPMQSDRLPGRAALASKKAGVEASLDGVACSSASDCWAVGSTFHLGSEKSLNEIKHWDGKKWSSVKAPEPAGKGPDDSNEVAAVACPSASNCWAVGYSQSGSGAADVNQVLHWNGKKWSQVKVPDPAGKASGAYNQLYGTACRSASDCWAVGASEASGAAELNEALHWNGKKWSQTKTAEPSGTGAGDYNYLNGVACSGSACWAVGSFQASGGADLNEVLHWNGQQWTHFKTPDPGGKASVDDNELFGAACASSSDCWAVGNAGDDPADRLLDEALHWNGKKWARVKTPKPGGHASTADDELSAVACEHPSDCWMVGFTGAEAEPYLTQALHWNGKKFKRTKTPNPGGKRKPDANGMFGLACVSASDCQSVGTEGNLKLYELSNLFVHWNGKKWRLG